MTEYQFGGSRTKKIIAGAYTLASRIICSISRFWIRIAKWFNRIMVSARIRADLLKRDSEPIVIHISRVIPLDRWNIRIEFTENRKTRYCIHLDSDEGGYAELFASFKRGDEVPIIEAYYYAIAAMRKEWRKI